jgi:hypothetical protein
MTNFWRNWMTAWGWGVGAFGALADRRGVRGDRRPTRAIYRHRGRARPGDGAGVAFSVALLGAVTLGMALEC